jgi:hypothetical protein
MRQLPTSTRLLPLLVLAAVAACAPVDIVPLVEEDLEESSFTGVFDDSDSCAPGDVDFTLNQADDDVFVGMYRFESRHPTTWGDVGLYEVEGEIGEDGLLYLAQVDIVASDETEGWNWCMGEAVLGLGEDPDGPILAGEWMAGDCSCAGALTLIPTDRDDIMF